MNQPATTTGSISDRDKLDLLNKVINQVSGVDPQVSGTDHQVSNTSSQFTNPQSNSSLSDNSGSSVLNQVVPQVVLQATDTLNPALPVSTGQERINTTDSLDSVVVEAGGLSQVETEKVPELPVEVEGYLQHAEDHQNQLTQKVVITGNDITLQPSHRPTTPVVVLPITEEEEKEARGKNTSYGIRWLVEWSHKLIKKFVGRVIYRIK